MFCFVTLAVLGFFVVGWGGGALVVFFKSKITTNTTLVTKMICNQAQDGLKNRFMLKSHLLK